MAITLNHTEVAYNKMTPEQFKAVRLKMRLSQKKLGELICINARQIRRMEAGDSRITGTTQQLLALIWDRRMRTGNLTIAPLINKMLKEIQ